jgi:hypothetical protein
MTKEEAEIQVKDPRAQRSTTDEFGTIYHYKNGLYHREDGPAIEFLSGEKQWWLKGMRHREDGPAVELPDGEVYYWYKDKRIEASNHKEFEQHKRMLSFF